MRERPRNGIESFQSVADVERSLAAREPGLLGFLSHYNEALKVLRTRQDFYQATYDLLAAENDNGIVYVELTFDPQAHTSRGIAFDSMIEGIDEGRRAAAKDFGVEIHLIMAINTQKYGRPAAPRRRRPPAQGAGAPTVGAFRRQSARSAWPATELWGPDRPIGR